MNETNEQPAASPASDDADHDQGVVQMCRCASCRPGMPCWYSDKVLCVIAAAGAGTPDAGPTPRMERIKLAQFANSGPAFNSLNCTCDPSVGMAPCEYCAIYQGLQDGLTAETELAAARAELAVANREIFEVGQGCQHTGAEILSLRARAEAVEQEAERLRGQVAEAVALLETVVKHKDCALTIKEITAFLAKLKGKKL